MDEPLSNLDLKLREHMRTELKRLHHQYRVTTIYVTHDQAEALILSDRIAVMSKGEIQQVASSATIYEHPATTFVADFIGSPSINFLNGELRDGIATLAGRPLAGLCASGSGPVTLGVRPEDIILGPRASGYVDGTVEFTELYGGAIVAFIVLPGAPHLLKDRDYVAASVDMHQPIAAGAEVGISFRANRVSIFDAVAGTTLPCG
jgi:sn-glycerol 3-phosphate transport system ATP-binding protein